MATIVTDLSSKVPWRAARGSHNTFNITFTEGGSAFDISDYAFVLNVKVSGGSSDNVLQLTEGSGIVNNGAAGTLEITLTLAQINNLRRDLYYYEILYTIGGLTYPLIRDNLTIQEKNNASTTTSATVSVNLGGTTVAATLTLVGGGGGGSSDWADIENKPTTVEGFGITDAVVVSGANDWAGVNTFENTKLRIYNAAKSFYYQFVAPTITANRSILLPLLTATDTIAMLAFAQTLTNKTINVASNTLTATSAAAGDILKHNGTAFVRFAKGGALQVLMVNAAGTDLEWADISPSFIKTAGTSILTDTIVVSGADTHSVTLGSNVEGQRLNTFYMYALTDMHLIIGSSAAALGQFSYITSVKLMEITTTDAGNYDVGLRMGGSNGIFRVTASGASVNKQFIVEGFDSYSMPVSTQMQAALDLKSRQLVHKNNVTSSLTGSTSETIVDSYLIPAGTMEANDILKIVATFTKSGTASTMMVSAYLNTANNLTGATKILTHQSGNTALWNKVARELVFKNSLSSQEVFPAGAAINDDINNQATAISTISRDFASALYVIITIQLGSAADTGSLNAWYMEAIR